MRSFTLVGYAESFATAPLDASAQQQYADSFATAPLDTRTLGAGAYAESFNTAPVAGTNSNPDVRAALHRWIFAL